VSRYVTRRQSLIAGSLSLTGLTLAELSRLRAETGATRPGSHAPRANSCVFIFLFGGPSHIDLWDMKPNAPAEIRGDFQPVATKVSGIQICEHLPNLAQQMDKFCLLRSMTHKMNVHGPACSEIYSGREYFGPPVTDQALPQDWPSVASLVTRFGPRRDGLPPSVVLPWYTQFVGQDKRIAGQTGGRMGDEFNPFLVEGDPSQAAFRLHGLEPLPELTSERLARRRDLLFRLPKSSETSEVFATRLYDEHVTTAWNTLSRAQSAGAFDVSQEPQAVRDKYGWTKFGQSLLAARRLVEAGVPLVTVNWDDDSRADKVSPFWDTHDNNFRRLKDGLCPVFDRAFAAFLADLADRGLLDTTFVAASGEFGRTPRIGLITQNGMTEKTGRDHWPHAFTVLLAGGGVRGGQVYGETNATGGYVADRPVTPADLSATVLSHLGINPHQEYDDRFQRMPQRLSEGRAIRGLG
jgi:hypothetical protein